MWACCQINKWNLSKPFKYVPYRIHLKIHLTEISFALFGITLTSLTLIYISSMSYKNLRTANKKKFILFLLQRIFLWDILKNKQMNNKKFFYRRSLPKLKNVFSEAKNGSCSKHR